MDRRILAVASMIFVLVYMVVGSGSLSYAALFSKDAGSTVKAAKTPAVSPEELAARRDAMMADTKKTLNGQQWTVYVSPRGGKGAVETDVLTFVDETVNSKNLEAKGYPVSNFGMSAQDNGIVSWETMKTDVDKNKAFLRGDYKNGVMTGVIFMKPAGKGATSTYMFSTVQAQAEAAAVVAPPPVKKAVKK